MSEKLRGAVVELCGEEEEVVQRCSEIWGARGGCGGSG